VGCAAAIAPRRDCNHARCLRRVAPVAPAPAPALADALPSGVAMQDLPASVTREIPLVRGHKFVKFDDRIVVVDPASRLVVAMIPRYKLLP